MESWLISSSKKDSAKRKNSEQAQTRSLEVLGRDFYERDTLVVSRELLGKLLVVGPCTGRIVETEAYHGEDPASHSARGETPRSSVMFGDPGVAYVYFIYGNYEMLNFVTEKKGYPGAVLIRALEPISGLAQMKRRRMGRPPQEWTNGPGRLCQAMGIRLSHNRKSLQGPELVVADDGYRPEKICVSPRVGISSAQEKLWRFTIKGTPFVSRAPQNRLMKEIA